MSTLAQDLRALRKLKLAYVAAKEKADEAERKFKSLQNDVWTRMDAEETDSQRVSGVLYVKQGTEYGVVQDEDAFLRWATENAPELVKEAVRKGPLNELVRARIRNSEPLPDGVGFYVREYISQRAPGEKTDDES